MERVLCWMLALYWHFEKREKLCFWAKSCFFPGENIVQDVVFSYIKVVFAASRLPVRPLYICCGGNVKPSKDKGSSLKLHLNMYFLELEKHCPPPNYWGIGPQHPFHCKTTKHGNG